MNELEHNNKQMINGQLLQELTTLRKRVAEFEKTKAGFEQLTQRYQTTLESITDGFVSFDKEWRFTYVNDSVLKMFQATREELLGKTPWEVSPEGFQQEFFSELTRSCDFSVSVHFEEFYPEPINRWLECHCYPEPGGVSVRFRDVTERKEKEDALRKVQAELQLVANATPIVLTRVSRDMRYVFVNEACAKMFGRPREEIIGKSIPEIMGKEAFDTIRPYVDRVLQGESVQYEREIPYQGIGSRFMQVESSGW